MTFGLSERAAFCRSFVFLLFGVLAGCGGNGSSLVPPPPPSIRGIGVFDHSFVGCDVSFDGFVWYSVPSGDFSPIDVRSERCGAASLAANPSPVIPAWAKPSGPTQAIFVATSLQEAYSPTGMQMIESAASAAHISVSWMIANPQYLTDATTYSQYHTNNGDDVQAAPSLVAQVASLFSWSTPDVSVEGAGKERDISALIARGQSGFWGITWDSRGIDSTDDVGAPWGTYCADPTSYKRPASDGSCRVLAFEWTARDLTRAYLSALDYFYSTDPDDLELRAGFDAGGASTYEQQLVDAYAAAGQSTPLVMVSQQESAEEPNVGDQQVLSALYSQARADGMKTETLTQANIDARIFSARPRAVALPSIPGGVAAPSPFLNGATLYPATIDYHDAVVGMTFLAGHTTPTRVFRYADDPLSLYNVPLAQLPLGQTPSLTGVTVGTGMISFAFNSPAATRYGIALWSDSTALGISGPNVTTAGHAGVIVTFDLKPGVNTFTVPCSGCSSTTFGYAT